MPSPPANLTFSVAGASPGSAASWGSAYVSTRTDFGTYSWDGDPTHRRRAEKFWAWGQVGYRLAGRVGGDVVAGNVETFALWVAGQDQYVFGPRTDGAVRGMYNFVAVPLYLGDPVERFAIGWCLNQDQYRFSGRVGGDLASSTYDGHAAERFGAWPANLTTDWRTSRVGGDTVRGHVDYGALTAERFRGVAPVPAWTLATGSSTWHAAGHTLHVGDPLVLTVTSGSDFATKQVVYVLSVGSGTFTATTTPGGLLFTATVDNAGSAVGDPAGCWPL